MSGPKTEASRYRYVANAMAVAGYTDAEIHRAFTALRSDSPVPEGASVEAKRARMWKERYDGAVRSLASADRRVAELESRLEGAVPEGGSFIRLVVNSDGELELMSFLSPPPSYEDGFYPDEIGQAQNYYIVPVDLVPTGSPAAQTEEEAP